MNPLLDTTALPRFAALRAEHIGPAVDELIAAADAALARATSDAVPADYDAVSAVLDVATERLDRAWGIVGHLNGVADSPEWRAAYAANMPKVVEFQTRLGANEQLYAKYKAIAASPAAAALSPARRKALDNALRDFALSGADLQGAARERYAKLQEDQAELGRLFGEHVLDATDGFALYVSHTDLEGVPEDTQAMLRAAAREEGRDGCKLTLHMPSYLPVMQYAVDRVLRERLYQAYVQRASAFGPAELDNAPVIARILALRQEEAALLGYRHHAEVSLVPKMAASADEVITFLRDLARRARPGAERDLAEVSAHAREHLGIGQLAAWDVAFASEKLKESRYAFSDHEVKPYFTEPTVLAGLFGIIETLFEVRIVAAEAEVWHPSVRFYRVERTQGDGAVVPVAEFFLDAYARPGKRPGAWMDKARDRWRRPDGSVQTPLTYIVCNFSGPVGDKPALLTHDDVITLFHEFGHGLQMMLTRVEDLGVSGISGVEWDAVELPSQFMENFAWEWPVLEKMTRHVETGEPLPRALFDRMLAAKNFQTGLMTLRQIEFALIDMRLHAEPGHEGRLEELVAEVRQEIAVIVPPAYNRFLNGFSHIFAGGYSAGYYSYKWAEVLSADAWSAFEESAAQGGSVLDVATGRRYRQEVLETGGSRDALASFVAFRGRPPSIDALLRHQGLA